MPREDRKIYFTYEEVYKAVYALCLQREMKKPVPGIITMIEESKSDDKNVVLHINNPQQNKVQEDHYTRDFMAAALMVFCRSCRIPLPKVARKAVELLDGQVILHVEIGK